MYPTDKTYLKIFYGIFHFSNSTNLLKKMIPLNPKQIPSYVGNYIAGFVDGDGCFSVSIFKTKKNKSSNISWEISMSFILVQKEKVILSQVKKHLKCGRIRRVRDRIGIYEYRVNTFNDLQTKVIPFFNQFRFLSAKKNYDFLCFKKIAKLVESKDHLSPEGIKKILEIRINMNGGNSNYRKYSEKEILESLGIDFSEFKPLILVTPKSDLRDYDFYELGNYFAGFTDAEGRLNISFRKRDDYLIGLKVSMCFNLSQKDQVILSQFKEHLECGTMRKRAKDGLYLYEVNTFNDLQTKIIPFFNQFGFLSAKKKHDFLSFKKIAQKIKKKEHSTSKGILEILAITKTMNHGGNRKYSDEKIFGILRKKDPKAEYWINKFKNGML